jgi:hypothetical protein
VYLSPWAMVPDTVEYAEWKTGRRREGMLYGFFFFSFKLSVPFRAHRGTVLRSAATPRPGRRTGGAPRHKGAPHRHSGRIRGGGNGPHRAFSHNGGTEPSHGTARSTSE